ncbi:MAG: dicarboxylate/amino acid:cation symporter, partial [Gammaproteobacteria bacterium]|nr:dicarboxylate/amino acid:cation symporter [Gammaproteobacteria bacterium]
MPRLPLHWQIIIALVLAILAGSLAGTQSAIFGISFYSMFDFTGTLFLNALKMIIVPLIVASLITGIAGIGGSQGLGRLGGKAVLFYMTSSLLAILTGLLFVNLLAPGIIDGQPAKDVLGLSAEQGAMAAEKVMGKGTGDIAGVFLSMVPTNIVAAAANGQMLGLIFFSILFGYFMTRISEPYAEAQYNFWQGLFEVMMKITEWVMRFAPIGVFALVAKVVAGTGLEVFKPLLVFLVTVLLALA